MQRNVFSVVNRVAKKEVTLFFSSPVAYLFLAAFAMVTLFVFFWGESFFARNIADVRPLFEWMPLLLIFMCSTITMRQWSEERRTGTLEHVLTQPAPLWTFVLGKFFGCLWLLLIALIITLPLPITVSIISDLDWGPVLAGYLATFFLGAAYMSIGLFISSRSSNQIVSLILSVALCGVFYLIGSDGLTGFVSNNTGEWLRMLGAGSRFESITRGVIDLRDLYFYLSLLAVFLALNTYFLEKERWTTQARTSKHKSWQLITLLLVANALAANFWLGQLNKLRMDTTNGDQYSISSATRNYLAQLQEPLLIRGYFSSKTHPLLAPLVPQVRDLIREYEVAADGRVRSEFIDPVTNPELEAQANEQYGIKPMPFQVADRHQSSIVSSYFNVLIQYGDENVVLGFQDLIDVKASGESNIEVALRNPEHDLTQAIKKVLTSYQAGGNLFDTVKGDLVFTAYVSDNSLLPKQLVDFKQLVVEVTDEYRQTAGGRLQANVVDPQQGNAEVAQKIARDYGFQPMMAGLLGGNQFYFYMTLQKDDQVVQIPLDDMTKGGFERNLKAAIKRFASGFTKTIAVAAPVAAPGPYGNPRSEYGQLQAFLGDELNVVEEDLSDGSIDGTADILLLLAPENLDDKSLFAVDQFLMQGGTVVAASSPFTAGFGQQRINLQSRENGLQEWLAHHGVDIKKSLVLDPQNAAFPAPVMRQVGGMQIQEMRMIDYPYFVDVRSDGLNDQNPITAQLPQVTLAWASPIEIDREKNAHRTVTELISSSKKSWLSESTDIMPRLVNGGIAPYQPEGDRGRQVLAMISEGKFDSWFADKQSPLLVEDTASDADSTATPTASKDSSGDSTGDEKESPPVVTGIIKRSPESARLIVFASNDFLRDQIMQMAGSTNGSIYLAPMQLVANSIDWSLEDTGLMQIRSRGQFNRTLPPMTRGTQMFWEYLNYMLAFAAVIGLAILYRVKQASKQRRYRSMIIGGQTNTDTHSDHNDTNQQGAAS